MRTLLTKLVTAAAVVALVAMTVSCASSNRGANRPTTTVAPGASSTAPSTSAPETSVPTTSTIPPSTPTTMDVRVYFMHGDNIDVAHRTITATQQTASAAITELLAGPTPADTAAGLGTAIPAGTRLLGINISGRVATIDLTGKFSSGGGSQSMRSRLAQVTYTLTQFPTIDSVVFNLDGQQVTTFGGEGIMLDHPATRAGFEALTPPILVEFPGRGWAVSSPVRVSGSANVFEAQFQAEITDGTGRVIAVKTIHATSGTGTRGEFDDSLAFQASAGGSATLTVFDTSPKDGSRIDVVTIPLQLVGG